MGICGLLTRQGNNLTQNLISTNRNIAIDTHIPRCICAENYPTTIKGVNIDTMLKQLVGKLEFHLGSENGQSHFPLGDFLQIT